MSRNLFHSSLSRLLSDISQHGKNKMDAADKASQSKLLWLYVPLCLWLCPVEPCWQARALCHWRGVMITNKLGKAIQSEHSQLEKESPPTLYDVHGKCCFNPASFTSCPLCAPRRQQAALGFCRQGRLLLHRKPIRLDRFARNSLFDF